MKVFVRPPENMSRAMWRVANALEAHAPEGVTVVQDHTAADLLVHHVIGLDAIDYQVDRPCAVIQYCTGGGDDPRPWWPLWTRARLVWSYYDLWERLPEGFRQDRFYHAPLGIDRVFRTSYIEQPRNVVALTTGYVNGQSQEAIEAVAHVAARHGSTYHLGPMPTNLTKPFPSNLVGGINDLQLSRVYRSSRFVGALRYVEGFELPAVEGLACGARPLLFDRPDERHWFQDHAIFVPELEGFALEEALTALMGQWTHQPVLPAERATVLDRFRWTDIAAGFWRAVKEGM